jgi:ATP-dependent DNA ligase
MFLVPTASNGLSRQASITKKLAVALLPCTRRTCLPTLAREGPDSPEWAHEVKHDGCRMIGRREGDRVRVFSRRGRACAARYYCSFVLQNHHGNWVLSW